MKTIGLVFMLNIDYIVENISFTMAMEDMPLTEDEKEELVECFKGNINVTELLEKTIKKYKRDAE